MSSRRRPPFDFFNADVPVTLAKVGTVKAQHFIFILSAALFLGFAPRAGATEPEIIGSLRKW